MSKQAHDSNTPRVGVFDGSTQSSSDYSQKSYVSTLSMKHAVSLPIILNFMQETNDDVPVAHNCNVVSYSAVYGTDLLGREYQRVFIRIDDELRRQSPSLNDAERAERLGEAWMYDTWGNGDDKIEEKNDMPEKFRTYCREGEYWTEIEYIDSDIVEAAKIVPDAELEQHRKTTL